MRRELLFYPKEFLKFLNSLMIYRTVKAALVSRIVPTIASSEIKS